MSDNRNLFCCHQIRMNQKAKLTHVFQLRNGPIPISEVVEDGCISPDAGQKRHGFPIADKNEHRDPVSNDGDLTYKLCYYKDMEKP